MTDRLPVRKRNRLEHFDYSSPGAYFVTICTKDRKCLLSSVAVGGDAHIAPQVQLTGCGEIVDKHLRMIPGIEQYVIMPNHIHLIIRKYGGHCSSLSQDIKSFKTLVSKKVGCSLWQSSFYDHIIRDELDYLTKVQYIENNPARWHEDELFEA